MVNIVHFDIKPENLLIDFAGDKQGVLKIADFGVSRLLSDNESMKQVGGTRMFSPPEYWINLANSKELDSIDGEPFDIWAIGVTFFYLLYGRYPF